MLSVCTLWSPLKRESIVTPAVKETWAPGQIAQGFWSQSNRWELVKRRWFWVVFSFQTMPCCSGTAYIHMGECCRWFWVSYWWWPRLVTKAWGKEAMNWRAPKPGGDCCWIPLTPDLCEPSWYLAEAEAGQCQLPQRGVLVPPNEASVPLLSMPWAAKRKYRLLRH